MGIKEKNEKRISLICAAAAILLGLIGIAVRIPGLDHISGDMEECLIPWYNELPAHQGIDVLRNYTGNYGIPYVFILWILHYFPGAVHIKIKAVSVFFEFAASVGAGLLASHFYEGNRKKAAFVCGFGLTVLYPALVINGAYWGQCDGIYSSLLILALYLLFEDRHFLSFVLFGAAFAFKLQAVFILPFLILYLYRRRTVSFINLLIIPVVVEIMYIPGFIAGYGPLAPVTVYMGQTADYPQMYMHYPNLWCYFWSFADYEMFHVPVIGWVAAGFALSLCMLMLKGRDLSDRTWISVAMWSSLFPVYFLPAMHERYSTAAELIAVIYAILRPKRSWTSVFLWLTISWAVYQPMIMDRFPEQEKTAIGMMFVLIALTVFMIKDVSEDEGCIGVSRVKPSEIKMLELFDRCGMWLVLGVVLIIFIFSGYKALSFEPMMILEDVQANLALLRTPMYRICMAAVGTAGGICGMDSDAAVKLFGVIAMAAASVLWGFVVFSKGPSIKRCIFSIAFLVIPATVFYTLVLGSADGICLCLCGAGVLFLKKWLVEKRKACMAISCTMFSLSVSIMPSYLIFIPVIIFMVMEGCFGHFSADDPDHAGMASGGLKAVRDYTLQKMMIPVFAISACALLTFLLGPLTGLGIRDSFVSFGHGFLLQGAVWVPVSVILLVMCAGDRRYILSLLAFEFALTIGYGKYIGSVKEKYYIIIPLMIIGCILNAAYVVYTGSKSRDFR